MWIPAPDYHAAGCAGITVMWLGEKVVRLPRGILPSAFVPLP